MNDFKPKPERQEICLQENLPFEYYILLPKHDRVLTNFCQTSIPGQPGFYFTFYYNCNEGDRTKRSKADMNKFYLLNRISAGVDGGPR